MVKFFFFFFFLNKNFLIFPLKGVVEDNENVLIDFGTGYFVERNNV